MDYASVVNGGRKSLTNRLAELLQSKKGGLAPRMQSRANPTTQDQLDAAAMGTMFIPGLGDVTGLAADAHMYATQPDSRNLINYLLTGASVLPVIPAASQVKKAAEKIKAYHGSPHDFDEFKMSQIGTGEGAQAYGHGLYFAESEDVARGYKEQLTRAYNPQVERDFMDAMEAVGIDLYDEGVTSDELYEFATQYVTNKGDLSETLADARRTARLLRSDGQDASGIESVIKAVEKAEKAGFQQPPTPKGRVYQVEIDASPDELLDWDLPLSEQPEIVGKLRSYVDSKKAERGGNILLTDQYTQSLDEMLKYPEDVKGWEVYSDFQDRTGGPLEGAHSKGAMATGILSDSNIKGIRYKDGFSRGAEGGTSNYVIFDDRLISIAKKYGVAIPVAAAMLARQTGQNPDEMYKQDSVAPPA